jgi:hypothetical protein
VIEARRIRYAVSVAHKERIQYFGEKPEGKGLLGIRMLKCDHTIKMVLK